MVYKKISESKETLKSNERTKRKMKNFKKILELGHSFLLLSFDACFNLFYDSLCMQIGILRDRRVASYIA